MLHLSVLSSHGAPRPAVRLGLGTLSRRMDALGPEVFDGLSGFLVGISVVAEGEAPPRDNPAAPGRLGHRKADGLLTTDIVYDEASLGRAPKNNACLAHLLDRLDAAIGRLAAWCDRKSVWADRAKFENAWSETRADLGAARFLRPYEFARSPAERDALDGHWRMGTHSDIDGSGFDAAMLRYFRDRDRFWEGANYVADPSRPAGRFGQPTLVANHGENIATARPPSAREGYNAY